MARFGCPFSNRKRMSRMLVYESSTSTRNEVTGEKAKESLQNLVGNNKAFGVLACYDTYKECAEREFYYELPKN